MPSKDFFSPQNTRNQRCDAEQIPTIQRVNAHTISYRASDYLQGYRLLRLLYRYLRVD
ncbi:MAG: hypothetical protein HY314_08730 [Acidobacteria bacterium]|nr:hypothetical protein [Acidobacteriota bacterium]